MGQMNETLRNVALAAHGGAGKTSLAEIMIYKAGMTTRIGRVEDGNTVMDFEPEELKRQASLSSGFFQLPWKKHTISLIDTPGDQNFISDAKLCMQAAEVALILVDAVDGVKVQTEQVAEFAAEYDMPCAIFINKLDRDGMSPLDVMGDIEDKLQIECAPLSWPIGMGKRFRGIYNLHRRQLHLFVAGGKPHDQEGLTIRDLADPQLDELLGSQADDLREDVELLEGAANPFELEAYLKGSQTPVFFGSAINNFGVRELLDAFVAMAPAPQPRPAVTRVVDPEEEAFSGFAFKIQANMDPAHRDRIAFVRICSGKFERGMKVFQTRLDKQVTLSNATIFMAQDRTHVDEAYPGDIIGIHNHGTISIGDTFCEKERLSFTGIPSFAPDHFRRVQLKSPLKAKQLLKGLVQLAEEGAVQFFRPLAGNAYILGAVGVLQFDVTMARLKAEYGVDAVYEPVSFAAARWITSDDKKQLEAFEKDRHGSLAHDSQGKLTFLASSLWRLENAMEEWPAIRFHKTRELAA